MRKKIVRLLLTAALMLIAVPIHASASSVAYGDVNTDGITDHRDSLALENYITERDKTAVLDLTNADVNLDNKVDLKDLLLMRKFTAEWDVYLGPEAPCKVSIRVGNENQKYETVWSRELNQYQRIDLPSDEEIKELLGWTEAAYIESTGYGEQKISNVYFTSEEVVYDYEVTYQSYTIPVTGIQNPDGTTTEKDYTVVYGDAIDFSDLADTGINKEGEEYTKFTGVTTDTTVEVDGVAQAIDLTKPVDRTTAQAFYDGITATANYVDDTATATFTFDGIKQEDIVIKVRKGEELKPEILGEIEYIVANAGQDITEIAPTLGKVEADTTYTISCGELTGTQVMLRFETNGGSYVPNLLLVEGSLLAELPPAERTGYTFDGWYTDVALQNKVCSPKVPIGGATYYAKWNANEYTVTLDTNGGAPLAEEESTINVVYDEAYGTLPELYRQGYGFLGWYTAAEGGTQITDADDVTTADNHTLYAQWKELEVIPNTVFNFGKVETFDYEKGTPHEAVYTYTQESGKDYSEDEFTVRYKCQGMEEFEEGIPTCAGTYDVIITRPQDDVYAGFEHIYESVLVVNKLTRTLEKVNLEQTAAGYTFVEVSLVGDGGIEDLDENATIVYNVEYGDCEEGSNRIYGLTPGMSTYFKVTVKNDRNYEDATTSAYSKSFKTLSEPEVGVYWTDIGNYDISWYSSYKYVFEIYTPEQLAGVAYLTQNSKDDFRSKTIILQSDIDLSGKRWKTIGTSGLRFLGNFDGNGHEITGLYMDETGSNKVGLFGEVQSGTTGGYSTISRLTLGDGYIKGNKYVAGIVGYAGEGVRINSCVNRAMVISNGDSSAEDADCSVGGIVGFMHSPSSSIMNCVNYGNIVGGGNHVAGIIGWNYNSKVDNCINYGSISGYAAVGGIAGQNSGDGTMGGYTTDSSMMGYVTNCANIGEVVGYQRYIGAIIGRNTSDLGMAEQCYYLKDSARASKDNSTRRAFGTKKSSLSDSDESGDRTYRSASFTSPDSGLSLTCGYNTLSDNLITALNNWVAAHGCSKWVPEGPGGYSIPVSILPEE